MEAEEGMIEVNLAHTLMIKVLLLNASLSSDKKIWVCLRTTRYSRATGYDTSRSMEDIGIVNKVMRMVFLWSATQPGHDPSTYHDQSNTEESVK